MAAEKPPVKARPVINIPIQVKPAKTRYIGLGIFTVMAVAVFLWEMDVFVTPYMRLSPQYTIDQQQISNIAKAIEAYHKKYDKRPNNLNQLVTEGLLKQEELFDKQRKELPKEYCGWCDVIYNPAVLPSDPPNCVLLHTVFVKNENDPFLVILNDGTLKQYNSRELVKALNDTYGVIGQAIHGKNTPETLPRFLQ